MMMMMLEEFHSCVSSSQLSSFTPAGSNSAHWWPTRVSSSSGMSWPFWVSWVSSPPQPWPSGRSPPTPGTTSSQPRPCTRGSGSPACPRAQASSSVKSTTLCCRSQVRAPVPVCVCVCVCVCVSAYSCAGLDKSGECREFFSMCVDHWKPPGCMSLDFNLDLSSNCICVTICKVSFNKVL